MDTLRIGQYIQHCRKAAGMTQKDLAEKLNISFQAVPKMNMDFMAGLSNPKTREVLYTDVLIQGILSGRTVDMDEIEAGFQNKEMVNVIRRYLSKTDGSPETTA